MKLKHAPNTAGMIKRHKGPTIQKIQGSYTGGLSGITEASRSYVM